MALMKTFSIILLLFPLTLFGQLEMKRKSVGALPVTATGTSYTLKDSSEAGGAGVSLRSDTSECWSSTVKATASYTPTRIAFSMQKVGNPTGDITVYIYATASAGTTEGPPDDRDVTAALVSASTLSTSLGWITFDVSGAAAWTSGKYYQVVVTYDNGNGTDYVKVDATGFVDNDHGIYNRVTFPPGTPDDAANWAENDLNGSLCYRVYASP